VEQAGKPVLSMLQPWNRQESLFYPCCNRGTGRKAFFIHAAIVEQAGKPVLSKKKQAGKPVLSMLQPWNRHPAFFIQKETGFPACSTNTHHNCCDRLLVFCYLVFVI
jgi:hypothetical protein